jgi:hypothetical protein
LGTDEENNEVVVKAPSKSVFSEELKAEKATVKALEEERFNVLSISKRVGQYFGLSSIIVGAALLLALGYAGITQSTAILFSSVSVPFIGLFVVAGLVSVFVGFLLIASE